MTNIGISGNGYLMKITKLGWIDIGHLSSNTNSNITFTEIGTITNVIDIYVIFSKD